MKCCVQERSGLWALALALALLAVGARAQSDSDEKKSEPIEEILITAQKRMQTLQGIAAAVTVVSEQTFFTRGISTLAQVQNLLPSVRLQPESASTEIYIRGVGSTLDVPMIEPPNAYNVNGVYVPREVTSASLLDVERLEVLPGPQGTLYGRGAIGGVVNTLTRRPSDNFETKLLLEAGNYSQLRVTLTQNLPVSDAVALRAALSYHDRDGYMASGADSADDLAGLLSMNLSPSDEFHAFIWAHIESRDGYAANLVSKGKVGAPRSQAFANDDPWDDRLEGELAAFATLGPITAQYRDWDTTLVGAEFNWVINDRLELTYLPSYLDFEWRQEYWLTHKDGDFNETIDQRTHELRLAYEGKGRLAALVGFYDYTIETAGQLFIQFGPDELFPTSPPGLWLNAVDVRDHELAGSAFFGEVVVDIRAHSRFVAGGRLSNDRRRGAGFQPDIVIGPAVDEEPVALFTGVAPSAYANKESWGHVDWKLGIEVDAVSDAMLYVTLQTGFQPGTFDLFPDATTRESELLAFTVGARNLFLDGRLQLNNELFYYDYDNLLTQSFDAATGTNRLTNADVIIYGDQLDLAYLPRSMPNTRVTASLGYLHARYDDFLLDELDIFNDKQMQNAPDWTLSLGLVHRWRFGSGAALEVDLMSRYESGFWGDFSHSSGIYQESYTKTDLTLTYRSASSRWALALWTRNLENQDVQAAAATGNPLTDPGPGAPFLEPPRTYGLRFSVNWSHD